MTSKDELVRALRRSENCWRKVFLVEGHGQRFDKYSIIPSPEAIAILAVAILNGGNEDGSE